MRKRLAALVLAVAIGVTASVAVGAGVAEAAVAPACSTHASAAWSTQGLGPTHANWNFAPGHWCMTDGVTEVVFQGDGNLVWYNIHYDQVKWATNTNNKGVNRLSFQIDGNIVLYAGSDWKWAIGASSHRTSHTRFLWQLGWTFGCGGLPGSRDVSLKHSQINPDMQLHYRDVCGPA